MTASQRGAVAAVGHELRICCCCGEKRSIFCEYAYICEKCADIWNAKMDAAEGALHPCTCPDPIQCDCKGACSCHFDM